MTNKTSKEDSKFHSKHEELTEKLYNTPGMLPCRYVYILTNLCNLKCDFCFLERDIKKDYMTAEDWINLSAQIPEYSRVTLTGGEPLLLRGFKEIFSYVAERFDCNLITNGILLTKEIIDYMLSFPKFKVLSLSIDNIGNTNRGVTNEQWGHLKDMLKYFIEKRNEIGSECMLDVKTMVLDETAESLFETYKYLREELNLDTHSFQFLKGSPLQHTDNMFDFEEIFKKSEAYVYKKWDIVKQQLEKVRQYNLENNKISFFQPKTDSLASEEPITHIDILNNKDHHKEDFCPCKFPWSSVHVNADGTLFCCLALDQGNVKETLLKDIINSQEMKKFREIIRKEGTIETCNRCCWLRPAVTYS